MDFIDSDIQAALAAWEADPDLHERAMAHNIMIEERLDRARLNAFEAAAAAGERPTTAAALKDSLVHYVRTYMEVPVPHVPQCFQAINGGGFRGPLAPEQKLVRLENLSGPLARQGLEFEALQASFESDDTAVMALFDTFLDSWNGGRDARPVFAAFRDQLLDEIAETDWPERLRDALGLRHVAPIAGPVAVALIEYEVAEVEDEAAGLANLAQPFAVPAFLDHPPYSQFFPTPIELSHGVPMALFEVASNEDLITEILHSRVTYSRHHIAKLGQITSDAPATDIEELRNHHLIALQLETERYDFGEEL